MELSALRALTDWLNDATYGVNAKLAALDLDSGDSAPAALVTIADETRHPLVARRRPPDTPSIGVWLHDKWDLEGEVFTVARDTVGEGIPVHIRIATSEAYTDRGIRTLYYYARAVRLSVRDWLRNDNIAARTRNQIAVEQASGITVYAPYKEAEDTPLCLSMLVHLQVRDHAP